MGKAHRYARRIHPVGKHRTQRNRGKFKVIRLGAGETLYDQELRIARRQNTNQPPLFHPLPAQAHLHPRDFVVLPSV